MAKKSPIAGLDLIDLLTLPLFVVTMMAEHRSLKKKPNRQLEPIDAPIPADDGSSTPDPLVPLGYEKKDTASSLGLLAGNIVIGFLLQGVLGRLNRRLFAHRISNVGGRRFSLLKAMSSGISSTTGITAGCTKFASSGATTSPTTPDGATTCRRHCDNRGRSG